jgi:succinyl-diaminopimelate desuccinylase
MKEFLKELVRAESLGETGELGAAKVVSAELGRWGIESRIDTWGQRRANVIAEIESGGRRGGLLFVCHLDVVGAGEGRWKYGAFSAVEREGRIWGRGSADMKGGIAAVVTAIGEVVKSGAKLEGDIIFLAAAGEETDSCGAKRFVSTVGPNLSDIAGVVLPEPTNFEVVTAHRGMLWLGVKTRGRAAHGSTPELGVNAISSMRAFLDELDNYKLAFGPHELLGECSMSVNRISGGKEVNVIPDECEVGIDIRTLPGQSHQEIVADFEKMFVKLKERSPDFAASVSVVREMSALETDSGCDFVKEFCGVVGAARTKAVGFTTDGPHMVSLGAPVVIFGPGKGELCHKPDEYIKIADVEKAVEHYKNIILKFLS